MELLEKARNYLQSRSYNRDTLQQYLLEGDKLMDSVHRQATLMEQKEQELSSQTVKHNESNIFITPIIILCLSLLLLFFVIMALLILRNRYNELVRTRTQLGNTNVQLEETANELKESDERFKELLEYAPDAIVIVNHTGNIQIVNLMTERMFGFNRQELVGKKVEILLPGQLESVHARHRENYFADPKFREMGSDLELKGKRKDGSEFPVEISLSPLKTKDGILVTAAIRDINRRKKTEEELLHTSMEVQKKNLELQRSNAQLQSFNYIASHDLQEPLRKIQVFTSKILDVEGGNLSERGRDYFKRIQNSSSRMQELVESLFNYSTLEQDRLNFAKVDLNLVVDEVRRHFSEELEEKNGILNSQLLPVIIADPVQMYQLFMNLVDNAIKYHKENIGPVITITVDLFKDYKTDNETNQKNFWKISVSDNGIGFDTDQHEKIFELFRRLHRQQDYPGTGIGLAICKKIVENHGGFISAESVPGHGSAFHIYLPETTGQ